MKKFILLALTTICAYASADFVEIQPGVKLYVEHLKAGSGCPTLVLANGLTYSTKQFEPFAKALRELDSCVGVVSYDMRGMGQTLLLDPETRKDRIPAEQQAEDLHHLVQALNITGSVSVLGLSYGGAIAGIHSTLYPDDFENYIGVAPMLERLPDQDVLLNTWVAQHKTLYPFDPRNDDELYDHYLRVWIYQTYPVAEPILMENPFKLEAAFRMVQGIKNWNAFGNARRFPKGKIHLVAAVNDEHVKLERMNAFWNALPINVRQSFMKLDGSKHKIPELFPNELAAWVLQILKGNNDLKRGLTFDGDPVKGEARSGNILIPLTK